MNMIDSLRMTSYLLLLDKNLIGEWSSFRFVIKWGEKGGAWRTASYFFYSIWIIYILTKCHLFFKVWVKTIKYLTNMEANQILELSYWLQEYKMKWNIAWWSGRKTWSLEWNDSKKNVALFITNYKAFFIPLSLLTEMRC